MIELDRPQSVDDIYLARAGDVDHCRPILQGDIFTGVNIPGVELEHELVMVVDHPCSMRKGAALETRLQAIAVTSHVAVPLEQWATGHLRYFPLPDLDGPARHYAACLREIGIVASSSLLMHARVACLSEAGILILQQRSIFNQSRTKVETSTLRDHQAHIFDEVDLHEDWNRALVPLRMLQGETVDSALAAEAVAFDAYLGQAEDGPGDSLRERLKVEHQRASVRRQVRQEITFRAELRGTDVAGTPSVP
jgi:hypothetical protein